jgi:hypothetical protein
VINLRGRDFRSQFAYDTPMDLHAGDVVRTRCVFRNPGDAPIRFGPRSGDEMCFNFSYVTPPPPRGYCNEGSDATLQYTPGQCAPAEAAAMSPPAVEGPLVVAPHPALAGGPMPEGLWEVDDAGVTLATDRIAGQTLDLDQSRVRVVGVAAFEGDVARLDLGIALHLATSAAAIDRDVPVSLAGAFTPAADDPGRVDLGTTCGGLPGQGGTLHFERDGDRLTLGVHFAGGPADIYFRVGLHPVH